MDNKQNGKVHILVIDDDKELIESLKEFLDVRGFDVASAYDGKSGIEIARRDKPDLIILDITMPDMDGRDVLIEIKKDDDIKDIPVIVLTGMEDQFSRNHVMELGAYEYLTKPYDSYTLLRQINNVINKKDIGEL